VPCEFTPSIVRLQTIHCVEDEPHCLLGFVEIKAVKVCNDQLQRFELATRKRKKLVVLGEAAVDTGIFGHA
jgi:hypothetical protein